MVLMSARAVNRATLARQMLVERATYPGWRRSGDWWGCRGRSRSIRTSGCGRGSTGSKRPSWIGRSQSGTWCGDLVPGDFASGDGRGPRAIPCHSGAGTRGGVEGAGDRGEGLEPAKVVAAAKKLLAKEPLTFTEVRDALQEQFPDVNERALGFCTRMLVPLVMYPSDVRWSWSANAR